MALLKTPEGFSALPSGWQLGASIAFLSGFLSLVLLRKLVTLGRWRPFSVYCAAVGLLSIVLSLWR